MMAENKKVDKQIYHYQYFFRHFSLRLSERYNLLISFEEYVLLSRMPSLLNPKLIINKNGQVIEQGFLYYQNQKIKVRRMVDTYTPLLTALTK